MSGYEQRDLNETADSDGWASLEGAAAFTCRDRAALWLHNQRPLSNVQTLQPSKRVLLHYVWESVWVGQHLVVWHIGMRWVERWCQLGATWVWGCILLGKQEEGRVVWNMLKSHVICLTGIGRLTSSKLKPLQLLLQCIIQSCKIHQIVCLECTSRTHNFS